MSKVSFVEVNHGGPPNKVRQVFLDEKPALDIKADGKNRSGRFRSKHDFYDQVCVEKYVGNFTGNLKFVSQDVVFRCSQPVYRFLRIMGVFPFTRIYPGDAYFKYLSPSFGYSLFAFIFLFVRIIKKILFLLESALIDNPFKCYVLYVAINRINIVRSLEGRFEEAVIAYLFLVNILPVCIVPLIWTETQKLCDVLNEWMDFEVYINDFDKRENSFGSNLFRKATLFQSVSTRTSIGSSKEGNQHSNRTSDLIQSIGHHHSCNDGGFSIDSSNLHNFYLNIVMIIILNFKRSSLIAFWTT